VRVLLDESVPRQLTKFLGNHEVSTVPKAGWAGMKNGELMTRAASEFDAFITGDQGIEFQQSYRDLDLGVVVLVAPDNRVETITGMAGAILVALESLRPGQLVRVAA
jgi:hypothetical protein